MSANMIQRSSWGIYEPGKYYNSREALMNQYGNFNCEAINKKIKMAQIRQFEARRKIRRLVDEQKTRKTEM